MSVTGVTSVSESRMLATMLTMSTPTLGSMMLTSTTSLSLSITNPSSEEDSWELLLSWTSTRSWIMSTTSAPLSKNHLYVCYLWPCCFSYRNKWKCVWLILLPGVTVMLLMSEIVWNLLQFVILGLSQLVVSVSMCSLLKKNRRKFAICFAFLHVLTEGCKEQ